MPRFLNTRGKSTLGIGICARCSRKMSLTELHPDPNAVGLLVCDADRDRIDPYRLAPHPTENISLQYARPDVNLYPGPTQYPVDQIQALIAAANGEVIGVDGATDEAIAADDPVTQVNVSQPWSANTAYGVGDSVTNGDPVGMDAVGMTFYSFSCIISGTSSSTAPVWPTSTGVAVADGTVTWINSGLYLP